VLPNDRFLKKLMLNGGSRVCSLLSLVLYPKCVYFASLTLTAEYWGVRTAHAPEQDYNHNLDCVALSYPCPINWLRVVSHNRTKCRENETREQNYFLSIMPMQVTALLSDPGWGPEPPRRPGGPPSTFFNVDGGRS
jgi:hypothetical protein